MKFFVKLLLYCFFTLFIISCTRSRKSDYNNGISYNGKAGNYSVFFEGKTYTFDFPKDKASALKYMTYTDKGIICIMASGDIMEYNVFAEKWNLIMPQNKNGLNVIRGSPVVSNELVVIPWMNGVSLVDFRKKKTLKEWKSKAIFYDNFVTQDEHNFYFNYYHGEEVAPNEGDSLFVHSIDKNSLEDVVIGSFKGKGRIAFQLDNWLGISLFEKRKSVFVNKKNGKVIQTKIPLDRYLNSNDMGGGEIKTLNDSITLFLVDEREYHFNTNTGEMK